MKFGKKNFCGDTIKISLNNIRIFSFEYKIMKIATGIQ